MILAICANPSVDSFWAFDDIQQGTVNRSTGESFYPGGKGIHTAFALNELGSEVTTLGVWGGQTGQWIKEQCLQRNIQPIGPHVDDWTRICITNQSNTAWNETELLGGGPTLGKEDARNFKAIFKQSVSDQNLKAVTIGGSIPGGLPDNLYHYLVEQVKAADLPVFLDASGSLLRKALPAHPYAIHINRDEGKELCGSGDPVEIARWLSAYCTIAAVTAGADGLYMLFEDELLHASYSIEPHDIHSTVGAGDCLLAGLCLATRNYDNPEQWAKFAVACGSANCINPELGMLSAKDAARIFKEVTTTSLSV